MEKIRAYELSKSFGFPSKEIVKVLHDYQISTKNHMSALSEYELDVIFEYYTQKNQVKDFSIYNEQKKAKNEEPKSESDESAETVEEEISVEVVRKVRMVDTRVNTVDLDRIDDEKLEEFIPDNIKEGSKKQKINQKKKNKQLGNKQKHPVEEKLKRKEKKEKKE